MKDGDYYAAMNELSAAQSDRVRAEWKDGTDGDKMRAARRYGAATENLWEAGFRAGQRSQRAD